jgi:hypothetical protein
MQPDGLYGIALTNKTNKGRASVSFVFLASTNLDPGQQYYLVSSMGASQQL